MILRSAGGSETTVPCNTTRTKERKKICPRIRQKRGGALRSFLIIISPAETIYHLYQSPTSPAKEKFANSSEQRKKSGIFHVHRRGRQNFQQIWRRFVGNGNLQYSTAEK